MLFKLNDKVNMINSKVDANFNELSQMIVDLGRSHQQLQSAVQSNQKHISQIAEELHEMNATMTMLLLLIPRFTYSNSIISSELKVAGKKFVETANELKDGKTIGFKFFYGLGVHEICGEYGHCPMDKVSAFNCSITDGEEHHNFSASFFAHLMDPSRKVIQAKPFKIYQENATHVCKLIYDGPKHFFLEKESSNVCPLAESEVEGHKIPAPPKEKCNETIPNNSSTLWKEIQCKLKNESFTIENDIRWVGGVYYIQCYGSKIVYMGQELDCPPYVFEMSPDANFSIGETSNLFYSVVISKAKGIGRDWVDMMDVRIPAATYYKKIEFQTIDNYSIPKIIRQTSDYVPLGVQALLFWPLSMIMILIIICACYSWCCRIKVRVTRGTGQVVNIVKQRESRRRPYVINIVTKSESDDYDVEPFSMLDLQRMRTAHY